MAVVFIILGTVLATSILSGVIGMAGGIILLSVMLLFLEPLTVIPLHGVVQLVSNSSRTWIQREHVERSIVWRYALPLLPLGFAAIRLSRQILKVPRELLMPVILIFCIAGASPMIPSKE